MWCFFECFLVFFIGEHVCRTRLSLASPLAFTHFRYENASPFLCGPSSPSLLYYLYSHELFFGVCFCFCFCSCALGLVISGVPCVIAACFYVLLPFDIHTRRLRVGTARCPSFDHNWKYCEFENEKRALLAQLGCFRAFLLKNGGEFMRFTLV